MIISVIRLPMRHTLLKALLLSSALTLPLATAHAGTAAATARVNARVDEAARAEKGESKKKDEAKTTSKSTKSAEKASGASKASNKSTRADPTSKGKKGSAATAKPDADSDEVPVKKKSGLKSKSAEASDSKAKKGETPKGAKSKTSKAAVAASKKAETAKGSKKTGKAARDATDAEGDDEKVIATASTKGTPYVIPNKAEKYNSRKSSGLTAQSKPLAKPAARPADKPVVEATADAPKPQTAAGHAAASGGLTTDADKAVNDLFGAAIKVEGTPAPHKAAISTPTEVAKPEPAKPAPKVAEKLDLPAAPLPYQATVKPETAPAPKADLTAALTAQTSEPRSIEPLTVSPPTPDKAAEVIASTALPVSPPPATADAPTLTVPPTARQPVDTTATPRSLASVTVDAYARDYEGQKTGAEMRYDSSIRSGLLARQSRAGDLEGNWLVSSLTGDKLVSLALRGGGTQVDGAWRSLQGGVGLNRSGLIESAMQTDDRLTLDYQSGSARGRYRLDLRREPDGRWRGQMIDPEGAATPVVMQAQ